MSLGRGAIVWMALALAGSSWAGPVEDNVAAAREALVAGKVDRARDKLKLAYKAAPSNGALVTDKTLATYWFLVGVMHHRQGDKKGRAMDAWRLALVVDNTFVWDTEVLADGDPQSLFEALRGEVAGRARVDSGVPEKTGAARLYASGQRLTSGDEVIFAEHLAQIQCDDGVVRGSWSNFKKPPKWFKLCPGGIDTSVVVVEEAAPEDEWAEFGPSFGGGMTDMGGFEEEAEDSEVVEPEPEVVVPAPVPVVEAETVEPEPFDIEIPGSTSLSSAVVPTVSDGSAQSTVPASPEPEPEPDPEPALSVVEVSEAPVEPEAEPAVIELSPSSSETAIISVIESEETPAEVADPDSGDKGTEPAESDVVVDAEPEATAEPATPAPEAASAEEAPAPEPAPEEPSVRTRDGVDITPSTWLYAGTGVLGLGAIGVYAAVLTPLNSQIADARDDPGSIDRDAADELTGSYNRGRLAFFGLGMGAAATLTGALLIDAPITPVIGPGQLGLTGRF